ncbi:ribonuclease H family protein [Enterococcus ureasiticus]|uniref:ribonuclease H1 domain-containing protein n=1 Tax=Enterococcus ureasiticus TaxID=903984 RepID=UPI001A8D3F8F|nr:ribonuclease H family protein [Enterococcus ureasiticus]MBO0474419.1 ribonuclease H family protein [Enterococcus ureasiticus]
MGKYYAVKHGRKIGIFNSWGEAEKQVKNFSGASFKSFSTKEEAESFLGAGKKINSEVSNMIDTSDKIEAYVDGSFDSNTNIYGTGVVIIKNGKKIEEIFKQGNDERFISSYQIAGEIFGALEAILWVKREQLSHLIIYYDYEGIEKWATGAWNANKPISQYYVEAFKRASKGISVIFEKVKAHSGNYYNELADSLAKKATKINQEDNKEFDDYKVEEQFIQTEGHKKNLYLNIMKDGSLYDASTIYQMMKRKWKSSGKKIGDIKKVKTIVDFDGKTIIFQVETMNGDLNNVYIYGDELNG